MRAFITGLSGAILTAAERHFVEEADPWGLILFKRNVTTPDALRRLIGEFRTAVGRQAPVLIDQEGGRVQRLGPPHWPAYPPGAVYGAAFDRDPGDGLMAARAGPEPAPASGAPDWSVRIVTVRIFFGPDAAGVAGTAVVPDGAAVKGETCVVPGAGFGAVAVVIAGAAGFGGSAAIVGLFDVGLAE